MKSNTIIDIEPNARLANDGGARTPLTAFLPSERMAADSGNNAPGQICLANEARFTASFASEPLTAYATDLTLIGTALRPIDGAGQRGNGTTFTSAVTSRLASLSTTCLPFCLSFAPSRLCAFLWACL